MISIIKTADFKKRMARTAVATVAVVLICLPVLSQGDALEVSDFRKSVIEKLGEYNGIFNSDQTVRVSGEPLNSVDKQIIMQFVEDVRSRLQQLTNSSFTGEPYRLSIFAENAEPDRPCLIEKDLLSPKVGYKNQPTIRISIINPSKMDARDLAREICDGYLSMKVLVSAQDSTYAEPPAHWFTAGLARYLDTAPRQDDAESFLAKWHAAKLPPLWKLALINSPHPSADVDVATQLVAYWLSFPDRGKRLDLLCRALGAGDPWSPTLFAETSSGLVELRKADRDFDVWLLARRDTVLVPGQTHRELVTRAYFDLVLNPGKDNAALDVPVNASPSVLVDRIDEAWTRPCARTKADRIMRLSAGRGAKFRKAAEKYAEFFDGVFRGEAKPKLLATLRLAEIMLRDSAE